jgi:hypothetical protein
MTSNICGESRIYTKFWILPPVKIWVYTCEDNTEICLEKLALKVGI